MQAPPHAHRLLLRSRASRNPAQGVLPWVCPARIRLIVSIHLNKYMLLIYSMVQYVPAAKRMQTWTSAARLEGQAAPQGRKAEPGPSVGAPPLGPPRASGALQRSGQKRSGCGHTRALVCSVCSGTCARNTT